MGHIPHVYVPRPWDDTVITLPDASLRHLSKVLRRSPGSRLSYTDGAGAVGMGRLVDRGIERGEERFTPSPPDLTVAVAPLGNVDRMRFVVEKLAELGVRRLVWLTTTFVSGRPPREDKTTSWAISALQQSRGAHLMRIEGPVAWDGLDGAVLLVDRGGDGNWSGIEAPALLVIGPEGGFGAEEAPRRARRLDLGPTVLRSETAAVVAAARALAVLRSPGST